MKRQIALSILMCAVLVGPATAEDPVYFTDANLKAAVEEALWINDPTPSDMSGLTSLNASSHKITDLTGLDYAINLCTLQLAHNQISNIQALAGLGNLQRLVLNNNQISDLSPVSGLIRL